MKRKNKTIADSRLTISDESRPSMLVLLLILLCTFVAVAQEPQEKPQTTPPSATEPKPERKISPEEARQLLGAVDEVLKFDSKATGLPIKKGIKRQLIGRDQVQAYIEKQMREDEDAQRLKNGEVILKKFGLVPRDFDVDGFLVQLLREQVAGYYDPQTRYVNLLDWLPPETQMPVLAHELTHALQDQNFGMEKWVKGQNHKKKMSAAETIADDESTVARHAILEGQAMAVMIDWMLAPLGKSVLDAPQIVDAMESAMSQGADSPVFNRSPLYLQRLLVFPYTYGLNFERALLRQGKDKAYAGVFKRPPVNTREVMDPDVYLSNEKLPLLAPPDLAATLGSDWELYDVGAIGAFDVAVIAEQFGDRASSQKIYPAWRGGYYYALHRKGVEVKGPAELGLVFVTKWADPGAQASFANLYTATVKKRYAEVQAVPPGPAPDSANSVRFPTQWRTSEGSVFVESHGDLLLVMESFDEANAAKLRSAVISKSQ